MGGVEAVLPLLLAAAHDAHAAAAARNVCATDAPRRAITAVVSVPMEITPLAPAGPRESWQFASLLR